MELDTGRMAQAWRNHCQQQGLVPVSSLAPHRTDEFEQRLIEQLVDRSLSHHERAVALRSIVELRNCSTRAVAVFFAVESCVIVASLSLVKYSGVAAPQRLALPALERQSRAA
jgi:hypothetical protein